MERTVGDISKVISRAVSLYNIIKSVDHLSFLSLRTEENKYYEINSNAFL